MHLIEDTSRTTNLLGALVVTLGDALRDATERAAGHGGAGPAAITVAAQWPGQTVGSLGERVGLSQPAGVRLIDRLATEGLLARRPGADGRTVTVAITATGEVRAAEVLAARRQILARALERLAPDEQAQLERLLERMLDGIADDVLEACQVCRLCEIPTCPQDRCPVTRGARRSDPPSIATEARDA